jgi:Secretion system C-terminal sorting domain
MKKKYIYTIFLLTFLFSFKLQAQENKSASLTKTQEPTIEGLTIYPNPVNSGKIFITTKSSLDKKVEIFNVLGKKVLESVTTSKEVNVSNLSAGVYIIKIKEGDATATRKLIIN